MRLALVGALLALTGISSGLSRRADSANLGDAIEVGEGMVPKRAYDPTPAEKEQDADQYRKTPGDGSKITQEGVSFPRRPSQEEAMTAVDTSVEYHKSLKKVLDKLAAGNATGGYRTVRATSRANEARLEEWRQTGAALAQKIAAQGEKPFDPNPGPYPGGARPVYDRPLNADTDYLPAMEPVNTKSLNGLDQEKVLPPAVHPPDFDDCSDERRYAEHIQQDTFPIMDMEQRIHPGREGNKETCLCKTACDTDSECLGYVETFDQLPDNSECWTIPRSKFPDGTVKMHEWAKGSTFLKLPPVPPPARCSVPAAERVLPQNDWGANLTRVTSLTAEEEGQLRAHEESFLSSEMNGLDTHPVAEARAVKAEAVSERKAKAARYYSERRTKIIQRHNTELMAQAERGKKQVIKEELVGRTAAERGKKVQAYDVERARKKSKAEAVEAEKVKERAEKQTPEGKLAQTKQLAKIEAAHTEQEAQEQARIATSAVERDEKLKAKKEALEAADDKIKAAQKVIAEHNTATVANGKETAIQVGDKVYEAMTYLEKEDIPY